MFERSGVEMQNIEEFYDPNVKSFDNELRIYEVFKKITLYLHINAIKKGLVSEKASNPINEQNNGEESSPQANLGTHKPMSELSDSILYSSISYSLSIKFILPKLKHPFKDDFKVSSLRDLNIGPLIYIQEHYSALMKIFNTFEPQSAPDTLSEPQKSEFYLQEFVDEINKTIEESEETPALPSIVKGIINLTQLRSLYSTKEVKEVMEIIGSGLLMNQLQKSLAQKPQISRAVIAFSELQNYQEDLRVNSAAPKLVNLTKVVKSKARVLKDVREDLYNLYDKHERDFEVRNY